VKAVTDLTPMRPGGPTLDPVIAVVCDGLRARA
jgi:hypothetical protein